MKISQGQLLSLLSKASELKDLRVKHMQYKTYNEVSDLLKLSVFSDLLPELSSLLDKKAKDAIINSIVICFEKRMFELEEDISSL